MKEGDESKEGEDEKPNPNPRTGFCTPKGDTPQRSEMRPGMIWSVGSVSAFPTVSP